ncbi:MAG: prepilin peptidase, partial [Gammaproteobacteria bacterium]|nr:prepilin peptidase [Gammaproteobacteria bacterium]
MELIEFFQVSPLAWMAVCLVLGLLVGSFLNVLVYRLPIMLERSWQAQAREVLELPEQKAADVFNLIQPNSCCPKCSS